MAKLTANTHVMHPETGETVFLAGGGDIPEWATPLIGEHLIEGGSAGGGKSSAPVTPVEDQDGPPPKGGAGSGAPAWREYAAKNDVEVPADASREDVIAALEGASVRTE